MFISDTFSAESVPRMHPSTRLPRCKQTKKKTTQNIYIFKNIVVVHVAIMSSKTHLLLFAWDINPAHSTANHKRKGARFLMDDDDVCNC